MGFHLRANALTGIERRQQRSAREDEQKLFTPIPAKHIAPAHALLRDARKGAQHLVAPQMPQLIVDALEVVNVQHGQAQRDATFVGQLFLLFQRGQHVAAVEASHQRIALGVFLDVLDLAACMVEAAVQALHAAHEGNEGGQRDRQSHPMQCLQTQQGVVLLLQVVQPHHPGIEAQHAGRQCQQGGPWHSENAIGHGHKGEWRQQDLRNGRQVDNAEHARERCSHHGQLQVPMPHILVQARVENAPEGRADHRHQHAQHGEHLEVHHAQRTKPQHRQRIEPHQPCGQQPFFARTAPTAGPHSIQRAAGRAHHG